MPTKGIRFQRDPARPAAFEDLTVTNGAAVGPATDLTPKGPIGALANALVENIGNNSVRYRVDGGSPTTTSGHRMAPGAADIFNEHEARAMKFIAEAGSTTMSFTFYRE